MALWVQRTGPRNQNTLLPSWVAPNLGVLLYQLEVAGEGNQKSQVQRYTTQNAGFPHPSLGEWGD